MIFILEIQNEMEKYILQIKHEKTINEWENIIYKPEDNNTVIENEEINEGLIELPLCAYCVLDEDVPNKYEINSDMVYNKNDGKIYYVIILENLGETSTMAEISTNSNELKFNLKNLKVELPKHTGKTISLVNIYIPIKEGLEEKNYDLTITKKYVDGSEEKWMEYIILNDGYDHFKGNVLFEVNESFSQDKVTVKYTIDDYSGRFTYNAFGKKYTLPCEAFQKEDGTWTSDAVDNFEKYVDQVVEKVDIKGFVNNQDFDNNVNGINVKVFYVIGFIAIVGIILLIRFVLRIVKAKQDEDY